MWDFNHQWSWSYWATPWPSWARPLRYPPQTLTRVSISRNSWREMTKIFLSRIAEANFHVSFSSRFSRNGGKVPLSPLYFQDSRKNFLSHLDFQDCGDQFLCILSIFKIFSLNILIINNFPLKKPTRSCFGPILKSTRKVRIRRQ